MLLAENMKLKLEVEELRKPVIATNGNASPATWIDGIRDRVAHLCTESKSSDNNRTRIMQELRKAGLTPGGIKYAPKKKQMKRRRLAKA